MNKSEKNGKVEYHKDTSRSDRCIRINCGETKMKSRSNNQSRSGLSSRKSKLSQSRRSKSRASDISQRIQTYISVKPVTPNTSNN